MRSGHTGRQASWVERGREKGQEGRVLGSSNWGSKFSVFPVLACCPGLILESKRAQFRNLLSSEQKCHQDCDVLFMYCKETSPGQGAEVLALILSLLQVCGVILGKLPMYLMRTWGG